LEHPIEPGSIEAEVLAVHEQFWQGYAPRDLDARFAVCAEGVTFFGTGLHERAVGKERYRAINQISLAGQRTADLDLSELVPGAYYVLATRNGELTILKLQIQR